MVSFLKHLRGSYRRHAVKGIHVNKGDPSSSSGACRNQQAKTQGGSEGLVEVRLTDSTLRSGEPVTWGSGQQKLSRSWET